MAGEVLYIAIYIGSQMGQFCGKMGRGPWVWESNTHFYSDRQAQAASGRLLVMRDPFLHVFVENIQALTDVTKITQRREIKTAGRD